MTLIRNPAVAGQFYPADATILKKEIQTYLDEVKPVSFVSSDRPKAIVVPHAGYIYSAAVAASVYKHLIPLKQQIKRVVLLGPSHRVAFQGLAVPESGIFNTPLGNINVDQDAISRLTELPQVIVSERAHRDEHSLEVQLPFLQAVLSDFTLVPIVVGDAEPQQVAEAINLFWDVDSTLVVISTDLSHYHTYDEARELDRHTSEAICNLKPELIGYDDACGRNGINGMLTLAKQKDLQVEMLDLRNSGDTAGSKDRVVGYGAYAIY